MLKTKTRRGNRLAGKKPYMLKIILATKGTALNKLAMNHMVMHCTECFFYKTSYYTKKVHQTVTSLWFYWYKIALRFCPSVSTNTAAFGNHRHITSVWGPEWESFGAVVFHHVHTRHVPLCRMSLSSPAVSNVTYIACLTHHLLLTSSTNVTLYAFLW